MPYEAAGKVFEGAKEGAWDIGFIAIEPVRAADIDFTAPYVIIEGTYMVHKDSPLKEIADVDKAGIRIAVGRGSAYDLYLTRTIKNATVVRAAVGGGKAMIEMWVNDKLEVAAGVRQQLEAYAKDHPEVRIMSGAFQQIQQAMGMPKKDGQVVRPAGAAYLKAFVEEMKASGFVADALKRSNQVAVVAPPANSAGTGRADRRWLPGGFAREPSHDCAIRRLLLSTTALIAFGIVARPRRAPTRTSRTARRPRSRARARPRPKA